jgi:hypothetical protein
VSRNGPEQFPSKIPSKIPNRLLIVELIPNGWLRDVEPVLIEDDVHSERRVFTLLIG